MPSGSARIPTSSTSTTIFRLVLAENSTWLGIAASDQWAMSTGNCPLLKPTLTPDREFDILLPPWLAGIQCNSIN
jgi:hypothetical protein